MNFGALTSGNCADVVEQWLQAASHCKALTDVRTLYSGTGWAHAMYAQKLLGAGCELRVVSAGFGLVSGDEALPSYAATFACQENQVAGRLLGFRSSLSAHAAWWESINSARGRTQTPLQNTFAYYDRVIIALSAPYLLALRLDLELLSQTLGPEKLWVIAVGVNAKSVVPSLRSCFVPLTSDVERLVSCPRATLNLRALRWWLEEVVPSTGWNRAKQKIETQQRLGELGSKETRAKQSLNDDEIMYWLREQRRMADNQWPPGGKSGLLRAFRSSGLACEQNRFSRLYAEVTARQ